MEEGFVPSYKNQEEQQKLDTQIKEQYLEIEELSNKRANLIDNITKEKEKIDNLYENEKNKVIKQLEEHKQRIKDAGEVYVESLERAYSEYEQSYSIKIQALADEEENISKGQSEGRRFQCCFCKSEV